MAGYSGTPLATKLGIKKDHRVCVIDAPVGVVQSLDLPDGVKISASGKRKITQRPDARASPDVIVYFTKSRPQLAKEFSRLADLLSPAGGLWIAWPKKASGIPTDLTEDRIREIGLSAGLVDNKVCAVDETWSGLRFVIRLKNRPKPKK